MTNHFVSSAEYNLPKVLINKDEISDNSWTIWHIGVGVGLLGGVIILGCSVFLTIFQFLYNEDPHGSWLYMSVLPLWIIGAHCFDKIEDVEKARRVEYRKKYGITDKECKKRKSIEENYT